MLDLLRADSLCCQVQTPGFSQKPGFSGLSRRHFLRVGALSGLGLSLPGLLAGRQAAAAAGKKSKDISCILIWTLGGTSHHDTFDPKPEAPTSVRGEFSTVQTALPGVRFTEVAPRMAREAKRFGLLRSLNPKNGSHGSADYMMMSGHPFSTTIVYPTFGSIISHHQGFKTRMPPFVQLGQWVEKGFGGGTAGYLGIVHNPFELNADPNVDRFSAHDITPPAGIDARRLARRRDMLGMVDALQQQSVGADSRPGRAGDSRPVGVVGGDSHPRPMGDGSRLPQASPQPTAFASLDKHYQAALNLITAPETRRAFEIGREDPRLRDRYGRTRFGQSCLLARRLIESGVRFVTVSDPSWDTHADNFRSLKNSLMPPVDQALPELLIDLENRGLLDTTLVVWLTDFGRTPKINSASGRDHWASAGFAIMAGAGIPGGTVIGRTDGEGGFPTDAEYFPEDVAATIYTKLGIPLDLITHTPDNRPIKLNDGRAIKEWM